MLGADAWRTAVQLHRRLAYVLSSHILSEVEALCDRVSIIRAGRVVESGTPAELRHLTRTSIATELDRMPPGLLTLPGVHDPLVEDHRIRLDVDSAALEGVLRALVGGGVRTLSATPPTLEELFLRHYGDHIGQVEAAGQPGPDQGSDLGADTAAGNRTTEPGAPEHQTVALR